MMTNSTSVFDRARETIRRVAPFAWLVLSLAAIVVATLVPGEAPSPLPPWCVICGDLGGLDFVLNIVLFVPYGAALAATLRSRWRVAGVVALTSLTIELLQLTVIANRDACLGDWIANTLGGCLGLLLYARWRQWLAFPPARVRRLSWIALVVWLALLAGSAWLLQPSPPGDAMWFGQWTPKLAHLGTFKGRLLAATLNDTPLPQGPMPRWTPIYQSLRHGDVTLDAIVIPHRRVHSGTLAPIASVFDAHQREVILLGQDGVGLVLQMRTHASDLWLREPTMMLPNVFPNYYPGKAVPSAADGSRVGDTVRIRASRHKGRVHLEATSPSGRRVRDYPLNVFLLWSAFVPFEFALGSSADLLCAVWAAMLALIPGYLYARRNAEGRNLVLPLATMIFGLVAIPVLLGLPQTPWWGWVATLGGCGVGAWLRTNLYTIHVSSSGDTRHQR
jgi:VanZ family protein